jgi:gluconolactonase
MAWTFERVAGPRQGPTGGLAWDGSALLFSAVMEERLLRFDPATGNTTDFRGWSGRTNGIAFGPGGELYGGQEGGRRVCQFLPDGSGAVTALRLDGHIHNHPSDLTVDRGGRIWFTDPYHELYAFGPQIFPYLDHQSVLRIERDAHRAWRMVRVTHDSRSPRALALSPDEKTLYVADGNMKQSAPRELRAYAVKADGTADDYRVLASFGADHYGVHRGIEGLCIDGDGNIVAVGGSAQAGPGPRVMVIAPSGAVLESHPLPCDMPMRCAFGDAGLASVYVSSGDGSLYRAQNTGYRGLQRF